jgi:hypothetical protein
LGVDNQTRIWYTQIKIKVSPPQTGERGMKMIYDKDTFIEMIRDWKADNAPEYDDLKVDDPRINKNGEWITTARDEKTVYQLNDDGHGNIVINYLGISSWGGPREGAGRPATGRKRQNFYVTDDENTKLREYLEQLRKTEDEKMDYNKMYCQNDEFDTMVRQKVSEGWKMFAHEHPENDTMIDVILSAGEEIENVKFQQKYLYKDGKQIGTCAIARFWR